ncbi:Phenylacetate 2-hydroxylase, partial [Pseudocercospora fuligena]
DRTAAWNSAFREEKVPLLVSLYKETMRFFTVAPFAIPRQASKDIEYRGIKIPKGMAVILNSQAVSHDTDQFGADAWRFNPERYLHDDSPLPHSAFGAGSRICPAVGISNRLTYAILMRLILAFRFHEPIDGMGRKPDVHPINFSDSYQQVVSHPKFFDCHFVARDPDWLASVSK